MFGPPGEQEPDPDKLDEDIFGSAFNKTTEGITNSTLTALRTDMPLCGVNYSIQLHSTAFLVGWCNSRDNQLWEKAVVIGKLDLPGSSSPAITNSSVSVLGLCRSWDHFWAPAKIALFSKAVLCDVALIR